MDNIPEPKRHAYPEKQTLTQKIANEIVYAAFWEDKPLLLRKTIVKRLKEHWKVEIKEGDIKIEAPLFELNGGITLDVMVKFTDHYLYIKNQDKKKAV